MRTTCGMLLAAVAAAAALGDTVEEREKRTDEIAQWLPAEPKADGAFDVRDFDAKGEGETKDTAAIQRAIDAASAAGGGEVLLPKGIYLCGSVFLKNGVDFHIAEGAVLKGSPDPADYNALDIAPQKWGRLGGRVREPSVFDDTPERPFRNLRFDDVRIEGETSSRVLGS